MNWEDMSLEKKEKTKIMSAIKHENQLTVRKVISLLVLLYFLGRKPAINHEQT